MSEIEFRAIDPERLQRMREQESDEYGNPWQARVAEGWEPLRCCLRLPAAGEQIVLMCYSPWTEASPWAEAGPVFVHFAQCAGYSTPGEYPEAFRRSPLMLNTFDHEGARAYEHITFVAPEEDHEAAVRAVMAHPDVAYLHVRSSTAGCFSLAVHRSTVS